MPDDDEWRILAEEAAQEQDPKKLIEIINSLTAALDERGTTKAAGRQMIPSKKAEQQAGRLTRSLSPAKSRPA